MDQMAIRKHLPISGGRIYWYWYVDFGGELLAEAKDELVLMIAPINGSWKSPKEYFLENSLNDQQKAHIVKECITKVVECNEKVVSLTFVRTWKYSFG